jgi:hypothetical protein
MGIIRCKGYLYCTIGSDGWDGQNLGKIIIVDSSSCLCTLDRIFISCLMVLFEEGTAGDPRTILLFVSSYVLAGRCEGRRLVVPSSASRPCQEPTRPTTSCQPSHGYSLVTSKVTFPRSVGRTTSVQPSWSISNIIITHPRDV